MKAVVTVKLPRNPRHDPRNKKIGRCPLSLLLGRELWCTDVTGSHHSYIEEGCCHREIEKKIKKKFGQYIHITRIEFFDEDE